LNICMKRSSIKILVTLFESLTSILSVLDQNFAPESELQ
jgi:hypothetical protein